jgi:hypothetical protein
VAAIDRLAEHARPRLGLGQTHERRRRQRQRRRDLLVRQHVQALARDALEQPAEHDESQVEYTARAPGAYSSGSRAASCEIARRSDGARRLPPERAGGAEARAVAEQLRTVTGGPDRPPRTPAAARPQGSSERDAPGPTSRMANHAGGDRLGEEATS